MPDQTPELPRYHTNDPVQFKQRWEDNHSGSWLATRLSCADEANVMIPTDHVVVIGPYRDVYQEVLRRWPVRTYAQGFSIEPVGIVRVDEE